MPDKAALYDKDFFAWSNQQAGLLRAGKLGEADLQHIAEEIESMGKAEKRELISRLTVLLLHLLKWQHQPAGRGNSWRLSIANSRDEITDHLLDNPSLKSNLAADLATGYKYARRKASAETNLSLDIFPSSCPWEYKELIGQEFWPE